MDGDKRMPRRPERPTEERAHALAEEATAGRSAQAPDPGLLLAKKEQLSDDYRKAMAEWRDDTLEFVAEGIARLLGEAPEATTVTEGRDDPSPEANGGEPSVPRLSDGGGVSLSRPEIGFTTLHVGQCSVGGVSYLTDGIVEDICDWFVAVLEGRDFTVELDCESYGTAFLVTTAGGDVIVCRDSEPPVAYADFFSDAPAAARRFIDSIRADLDAWVSWTLPEAADKPMIEMGIVRSLSLLENAAERARLVELLDQKLRETCDKGDGDGDA